MPEETQSKGYPEYKGYYQPDLPADNGLSSLNEAYQEGGYEALAKQLTPEQKKAYQEGGYEALAKQLTTEQKIAYRKGGDEAVDILHSPRQAAMDNSAAYRRALEAVLTGTCEASEKRAQLDTILKDLQPKPIHPGDEQEESEFDHYAGDRRVSDFLRERIEATDQRFQEQDQIEKFFLDDLIPTISTFPELEGAQRLVESDVKNGKLRPDNVILVTQALNKKRESLQDKYYEKEYLNDQLPRLRNTDRSAVLKGVYREMTGLLNRDITDGKIRAEQAIEFQQAFNDRISALELSGK